MTPQEFIDAISLPAQQSMVLTRIPASFVIAEGALESRWGNSLLAQDAMNLFGVKADASWTGDVFLQPTREYFQGKWVMIPARWRKYATWINCLNDHAQFLLQNERYKAAFAFSDDVQAFTHAVAAAGYATDPSYAAKIMSIIRARNLFLYDKEPT